MCSLDMVTLEGSKQRSAANEKLDAQLTAGRHSIPLS